MRGYKYLVGLLASLLVVTQFLVVTAGATTNPQTQGLLITPVRAYLNVTPGQSQTNQITIADITPSPLDVTLSVQQFSVANYTYNFTFSPASDEWVAFNVPMLHLQPGQSQSIPFTVTVPKGATPGGHYFTLFASAALHSGTVTSNVQVTTVLYLTVAGNLNKSSVIRQVSIPSVVFGGDIPFTFNVQNTGNTHFFIYPSGKLEGWTAKPAINESAHIVLPGTIRTEGGTISAPLLPGIYRAVFGYKLDDGNEVTTSRYIVYAPLWVIIIPIGAIWSIVALARRKRIAFKRSSN